MTSTSKPKTDPAPPTDATRPLRLPEMLGYAAGDVGYCFYWKTFELFILFFYTDTFGISPAIAGTMLLTTRVLDAAIDPLVGMWADRTRTRFGSFRPFVIVTALPLAILGVLTFTTPDLSPTGKVIWAYMTYGLTMLMYTLGNIPYGAMLGVLTGDVQKRTTLSSFKLVGAALGGVIVAKYSKDLVDKLGGGDNELGWQLTMAVYGVIGLALLLVAGFSTRERVRPPEGQQTSIKRDLKDLVSNGPWLTLFFVGFVIMLTIAIRNGIGVYYVKYYAQRDDLIDTLLTWSMVGYLVGAAITPLLSRFAGKKALMTWCMGGVGLLSFALYFVPQGSVWLMIGLTVATSVVLGPKSPLTWAMYADAADYSEWKNGRRATALVFSAATFGVKTGGAVAQWIVGLLLSAVGYVPNQQQSPEALKGILLLATIIPGVFALLAAGLIQLYPISHDLNQRIQRELEDRRQAAASGG